MAKPRQLGDAKSWAAFVDSQTAEEKVSLRPIMGELLKPSSYKSKVAFLFIYLGYMRGSEQ